MKTRGGLQEQMMKTKGEATWHGPFHALNRKGDHCSKVDHPYGDARFGGAGERRMFIGHLLAGDPRHWLV